MAEAAKPAKSRKPRRPPKKKALPSKSFGTKVSSGAAAFLAPSGAIDGRSLPARRFVELVHDVSSDMGGRDDLSAVQKQLVKRFVGACVIAELMEAKLVAGGDVDVAQYSTLANTSNRLAASIGIRRQPRDVVTLEAYLASKAAGNPHTGEEPDPDDEGGEDA